MSGHSINITTCRHITFALSQPIFTTLLFLLALLHGLQDLPWAGIEPWLHQEIPSLASRVQSLIPSNWSWTFFSLQVPEQNAIHMHVYEVAQSCLTLSDAMDCGLPGSSVHGILQARILKQVAISSSRGSSQQVDSFFLVATIKIIYCNWRLITSQYCSGFCHTLTWISHGCTCVPCPEPPSHSPLHPIPQGHPSAPALSTLPHAWNLVWRSISHMVIYMLNTDFWL